MLYEESEINKKGLACYQMGSDAAYSEFQVLWCFGPI